MSNKNMSSVSELNEMLDWHSATELPSGELLGRLGVNKGKRDQPQKIPDKRILRLDDLIDLENKNVLELGCFEGIHTIGLVNAGAKVTAIDARPSNVAKTLVRCAYHGVFPKVYEFDVENLNSQFGSYDLIFHCGVLYHLQNPIEHLLRLKGVANYIFLDTHISTEEKSHAVMYEGIEYFGCLVDEGGWSDPFSGVGNKSLWLTKESLMKALNNSGYLNFIFSEVRDERNGARISLLASR